MDKIFKIGLLVLGVGYLVYLFCPIANQVGRYSFRNANGAIWVLDTANADVYVLVKETGYDKKGKEKPDAWLRSNIKTGKWSIYLEDNWEVK